MKQLCATRYKKGREFRGWAVGFTRVDDLAPYLLKNVLRGIPVAAKSQQVSIHGVLVTAVKDFERCNVAILVAQHQGAVFRCVTHGRKHRRAPARCIAWWPRGLWFVHWQPSVLLHALLM